MEKSYNFSSVKFSDLREIIDIRPKLNDNKFLEWFTFSYTFTEFETLFLEKMVNKHRLLLSSYQEDTLKVKFIGAIFNQVDFATDNVQDWYHANLSGYINGVEFNGFVDYMIAKGDREPQKPYFFIQEFKPSIPDKDPEVQLLAEMLITIEKNGKNIMRGGYIIGQFWKFVVLEKLGENQFEYFVSKAFDSLDLEDLKQIYVILQAVKHKYCKD